jgi:hypothetical protein
LGVALYSVLTDETSMQEAFSKNEKKLLNTIRKCLFMHCASELTPRAIASGLLKCLTYVKSQVCFIRFDKYCLELNYFLGLFEHSATVGREAVERIFHWKRRIRDFERFHLKN